MKRKAFNFLNVLLSVIPLGLILIFALFIWKSYFLAYQPVTAEEEEIPSFLEIQSIKKSAQLRQEISQLTIPTPSASLKTATPPAEVKGEKILHVEIINLSGQERAGWAVKNVLEKSGFVVHSQVSGQITVTGARIYYKPSVSQESLGYIEKVFPAGVKIIKKEASLPPDYFVDIRIFLGR